MPKPVFLFKLGKKLTCLDRLFFKPCFNSDFHSTFPNPNYFWPFSISKIMSDTRRARIPHKRENPLPLEWKLSSCFTKCCRGFTRKGVLNWFRQKKIQDDLNKGYLNQFQIGCLKLLLWAFWPKMNYGSHLLGSCHNFFCPNAQIT